MQNNPNNPQPNTYYPPQQAPPPPPKRRLRPALLIGVLVLVCIIGSVFVYGQDRGVLPGAGTWTTTHTFTGTSNQQTALFSVADDWKIRYTCAYQQIPGATPVDGALGVIVHSADSSVLSVPVNARCTSAATSGETEEHVGGSIYLEIDASTGGWTVQVQELK